MNNDKVTFSDQLQKEQNHKTNTWDKHTQNFRFMDWHTIELIYCQSTEALSPFFNYVHW